MADGRASIQRHTLCPAHSIGGMNKGGVNEVSREPGSWGAPLGLQGSPVRLHNTSTAENKQRQHVSQHPGPKPALFLIVWACLVSTVCARGAESAPHNLLRVDSLFYAALTCLYAKHSRLGTQRRDISASLPTRSHQTESSLVFVKDDCDYKHSEEARNLPE